MWTREVFAKMSRQTQQICGRIGRLAQMVGACAPLPMSSCRDLIRSEAVTENLYSTTLKPSSSAAGVIWPLATAAAKFTVLEKPPNG